MTRHQKQSRSPSPAKSPFKLGDSDDDEPPTQPKEDGPVEASDRPLPSDAVDLIVDDREAVDDAQVHERLSGEPNAHPIDHVYVRGDINPDYKDEPDQPSKPGQTVPTTAEERRRSIEAAKRSEAEDLVREVSPPPVLAALQDIDENPWM